MPKTTVHPPRAAHTLAQAGVKLDVGPLTTAQVEAVARGRASVAIAPAAMRALRQSRRLLESMLDDGLPHYGINTGFGSFSRQRISSGDLSDLQRNLVRSHAAGVGAPLPRETVRAMMLLLAASLSRGMSGVRPVVVETIVRMLNAGGGGVVPLVPETGSVGASGDLAPLAHVALVLIGEGQAEFRGRVMDGGAAMRKAGIAPLTLGAKEGLALINGTHLMAAQGALFVCDFERTFDAALVAAAMSIDACLATDQYLDDRVHHARGQLGQSLVAARLRGLIAGSRIVPSHAENDPRVQDPYSFRCAPQVIGSSWDAFNYVRSSIDAELGAVTDNPLVFPPARPSDSPADIVSAGNFHGMPVAIPLDVAAIACSHIAGISERRVYHMLSGFDPQANLSPYLSPVPGLHSGLMIAQYAAAACCNEIITLCTPASVSNLSTSAGVEDYNSFGPRSAAKARRAADLMRKVIAIEMLCAAEAIEQHRPLRSSPPVEAAIKVIRRRVPRLTADRPPSPDIAAIEKLIDTGALAPA